MSHLGLLQQELTDDEKLAHAHALLDNKPMAREVVIEAQTRLLVAQWLMAEVQLKRMAENQYAIVEFTCQEHHSGETPQ